MAPIKSMADDQEFKTSKVFVSKTELPDKNKTLVGFGIDEEYVNEAGKTVKPTARSVMSKLAQINALLSAVESKIPITINAKDENNKDVYLKADLWSQSRISSRGLAYRDYKMKIELQPEIRNKAGELMQDAQVLYATKREGGYAFDKNNDTSLINKFGAMCAKGVSYNLSAHNNSTLQKYPKLMQLIDGIEKFANVEIGYIKQQGTIVKSITPISVDKDGTQKEGESKLVDLAKGGIRDMGHEI